jgi:UPF0755 protein
LAANKKKRFSIRRVLFNVVAILLLAAAAFAGYLYTQYQRFADAPIAGLAQATQIDVPIGANLPAIVNLLDERGLRPGNPYFWRLLARELGVAGKLHAGEYALDAGMTPRTLLRKMAAGEVVQHRFTIVEGWTFAQLRAALAQDATLQQTLSGVDDAELMRRLGDADLLPEGAFLPETYSYVKGMNDVDVLRRAREAMKKTLAQLWPERASETPLKTPYEALTLASIVEKETARAEERPQIARVFLSRLKLGMKLQTDPTVIYGMGANYDGNIRRRDLDTDTPYNTYTRAGLPPTPIALPGKAALVAVVHPAETEALYFVARGNGSHEFSATLDAHNRAVAKYQLHRQ